MVSSKKPTVLNMVADGLIIDEVTYGRVYKEFIQKNRDPEGNILDDKKESELVQALRDTYKSMGRIELAEVIETLVTYENFGGSTSLMKFIDITKRFVVATEKQPDRVIEFYSHWEKHCLLDKPHNNLEGLERAIIVTRVHDWLGGLK